MQDDLKTISGKEWLAIEARLKELRPRSDQEAALEKELNDIALAVDLKECESLVEVAKHLKLLADAVGSEHPDDRTRAIHTAYTELLMARRRRKPEPQPGRQYWASWNKGPLRVVTIIDKGFGPEARTPDDLLFCVDDPRWSWLTVDDVLVEVREADV